MFNKIVKYRFWISGGIIFVLGVCFLGAMFKTIGITPSGPGRERLLYQARQHCLDGSYRKAADLYEKELVLEPASAGAVLSLAIIYDDYLGRKARAVELYKRYLELEPGAEKREMVRQWMAEALHESPETQDGGGETYKNRLAALQKEMEASRKEEALLSEEVEEMSAKLYNIQAEHQEEIQALQEERDRLVYQVTNARGRISDLYEALQKAEEVRKEMQEELEEAFQFQRRRGLL